MADNIVERIQKLLNHERSARSIGSIAEAEAFAGKIQQMLSDNKLSMSQVEMEAEEKEQPVGLEDVVGTTAAWLGSLAMGVSQSCFCRVLKGHKRFIFIGRHDNRATAVAMFTHLAMMGKGLAESGLAAYKRTDRGAYEIEMSGPGVSRIWKNSFLQGYASALRSRLEEQVARLEAEAAPGNALVYVDRNKAAVDEFIQGKYGKLQSSRVSSSRLHGGAYSAGKQAGSNVSTQARAALA